LTVTGAGITRHMYIYKRQVTGTDQDRVRHILKVTGRQPSAENRGQKATGRKIAGRKVISRKITDRLIISREITGSDDYNRQLN